ncbi:hypothetical protein [Microbacterium sp. MYb62]|uniref:hypothetical protein n=1 Tax=Microbacterium sp. MYb62 TaxID=1848690 RepID=UPI000CFBEF8E|nr:hypothetical protein [Microbacterium sp. MYb62]PRB17404.1 hypothetical protein CQ042_05365 [Microbacterium sp. MYb62]
MQTIARTRMVVDEVGFFLAPGQDVADLKHRIVEALRAGGAFVEFDVVGDDSVSILVSASTHVVISLESVDVDVGVGGTGHDAAHYGGDFDLV